MPDNVVLNPGAGGATVATDELPGGAHAQRIKLVLGADNADDGNVSATNPLPVAISGSVPITVASAIEITNDTGSPIPVSGSVSVTNFPATQDVTGPLTDDQLRAAPVPISGIVEITNDTGAAIPVSGTVDVGNFPITQAVTGPLTNLQLRAFPVEVDGSVAVSNFPATQPVSIADPVAVTSAALTSIDGKLPAPSSTVPDNTGQGVPVRPIGQDIFTASFSSVGASVLDPQFRAPDVGTGVTYSQANGSLAIVAGTTANAEFLTRSLQSWRGSWSMRFGIVSSQRIANNNLAVMLADLVGENLSCVINSATSITVTKVGHGFTAQNVGQFMLVGGISGAAGVPGRYAIASVPSADTINFTVAGWPASGSCTVDLFGHSYARCLFTGTTATAVAVDGQRRGWATGDTTATINTTASPGTIMQAHLDGRSLFFADALRASSTTPAFTNRAHRVENIPDDNIDLYLFIWSYNGSTAPASSTTWTISFASVEKFPNFPVYIQGVRGIGAANPLPVVFPAAQSVTLTANTPTLAAGTNLAGDVSLGVRTTATNAALSRHLVSLGTTNLTSVKASAGRVYGWSFANTNAAWRYVKLHNIATAPTAGAGVTMTIPVPPNGIAQLTIPHGISFATGIGLSTVTGALDNDSTAVGANDIVGELFYA